MKWDRISAGYYRLRTGRGFFGVIEHDASKSGWWWWACNAQTGRELYLKDAKLEAEKAAEPRLVRA